MQRMMVLLVAAACLVALTLSVAYTQEAEPEGPSEDDLDKMLEAPKPKPKAEAPADDAKPADPAAKAAPAFPDDPRKIKVTIKLKSGKVINGTVKHFLRSVNLVDHIGDQDWSLSDGLTVQYQTDEFGVSWDKLTMIVFNKSNKENGEISCYEDSDKSPDRMECTMINQYNAFTKEKGKKAAHLIVDQEMFRFAVDTGKGIVNVDTHLGRVKITNQRDEERRMDAMEKELRQTYKDAILSITFH